MIIRIRLAIVLRSALAVLCLSGAWAAAQTIAPQSDNRPRIELAGSYDYTRSNAPPDGCTCFSLNGGGATLSVPLGKRFAWVTDASFSHADGIAGGGYSLNLGTYTTGGRYRAQIGRSRLYPFAQVLVGAAHASGTLINGGSTGENIRVANSGDAFALVSGGGLDLRFTRHLWLRAGEVDYVLTTFDNGSNNKQNNLRAGAGIIFRF